MTTALQDYLVRNVSQLFLLICIIPAPGKGTMIETFLNLKNIEKLKQQKSPEIAKFSIQWTFKLYFDLAMISLHNQVFPVCRHLIIYLRSSGSENNLTLRFLFYWKDP